MNRKFKLFDVFGMNRAELLKQEGNKAYTNHEYRKAAKFYRDAIQIDTCNPVLYANRSQCFLQLGDYERALKDTDNGLKFEGSSKIAVKLHYRRANALLGLGRTQGAKEALQKVLDLDPQNHSTHDQLAKLGAKRITNGVSKNDDENQSSNPNRLDALGAKRITNGVSKNDDENQSSNPNRLDALGAKRITNGVSKNDDENQSSNPNRLDALGAKRITNGVSKNDDENQSSNPNRLDALGPPTAALPMRYLTALRYMSDDKKIGGYKFVLNLDETSYVELFKDSGIDKEFLEFYLCAARYALDNDHFIQDPECVICNRLQSFAKFKHYNLVENECDTAVKEQILQIVEHKYPLMLDQFRQYII